MFHRVLVYLQSPDDTFLLGSSVAKHVHHSEVLNEHVGTARTVFG